MQDARHGLRRLLALAALLLYCLFALIPSILLTVYLTATDVGLTDRNQQLLIYQAIADLPFTVGAVLAVLSLRTAEPLASWRRLGWGGAATAVGFALLIVNAVTAPPA